MTNLKKCEQFIVHMLSQGFENAANSFGKILNRNIKVSTSQSVVIRNDSAFSYISEEQDDVYVLVTNLMGDFSGRSYLIFSREEADEIAKSVLQESSGNEKLREAMLLEVDNILSASVISEMSNSLGASVYGDVPRLKRMRADELQVFISGTKESQETYSIIYFVTTFRFDNERIHPQFIWKLSSHVFELIPSEKEVM